MNFVKIGEMYFPHIFSNLNTIWYFMSARDAVQRL